MNACPSTTKSNEAWVARQAERFCDEAPGLGPAPPRILLRDRDSKFSPVFDCALRLRNVRPKKLPYRAPNLNAHVERFIQSMQHECLERFVVLGTGHMDHLVGEYVAHYYEERPHQAMGNRPLLGTGPPDDGLAGGQVVCRPRLGGVLKHYDRVAARRVREYSCIRQWTSFVPNTSVPHLQCSICYPVAYPRTTHYPRALARDRANAHAAA